MKKLVLWFAFVLLAPAICFADLQQDVKHVIDSSSPKTVKITESGGTGSGFIISPNGYIITNAHVVHSDKTVTVIMSTGKKYKAEVISSSKVKDLALVKIKATGLPFFEIANSDEVYAGQFALAIGYPFGKYGVNFGVISNTEESGEGNLIYLKSDVAINPGNSGGPLLNMDGKIIGINDAIYDGANTTTYSIPSNTLTSILAKLMKNEPIKKALAGITVQGLTSDLAKSFGVPEDQIGVLVSEISETSNAGYAGLETGDIIVRANNKLCTESSKLSTLVGNMSPGDMLNLEVIREGKTIKISFQLLEAPEPINEEE